MDPGIGASLSLVYISDVIYVSLDILCIGMLVVNHIQGRNGTTENDLRYYSGRNSSLLTRIICAESDLGTPLRRTHGIMKRKKAVYGCALRI